MTEQPDWRPIETAPKAKEDDVDIWILACRQGSKLPMITTWDHEDARWYTFNLALEGGSWRRHELPPRRWEPTHWMPLPIPPAGRGDAANEEAWIEKMFEGIDDGDPDD
jgi:hypothetical protein